jgi:hypothetical protein
MGDICMSAQVNTWNSFWDLATPTEAAAMLRDSYGLLAAEAAQECASAAKNDDRETDYFFWLAVAAELKKDPSGAAQVAQPIPH